MKLILHTADINKVNNNADDIITSDPSFVRSLINKKR